MPAFTKAPPGFTQEQWDKIAGNYDAAESADPVNFAGSQRNSDERNALRAAQTASMGMLQSGPMSGGVDDPAAAFERFSKSGYSGADALRDGWLTGTGTPGWQQAGDQAPMTGMYGGGTATPSAPSYTPLSASAPPSSPATAARAQAPGNYRGPDREWRPADRPAMHAMYGGAPSQAPQPATAAPTTPAHWDMGEAGAAGAWSNGYNPHWVGGETQPPPSTSTPQPGQATQPSATPQQPGAGPAQPGGGQRAFGAAPRWATGGQHGGGRRRFGQASAMGNMYGGG